mmetsp:Transcript_5413/g.21358  ORF Transcript_5413/g.21358 Transcript_5413/m.21358 type:complete len:323 (+) Transcript_5413:1526-2494(+)
MHALLVAVGIVGARRHVKLGVEALGLPVEPREVPVLGGGHLVPKSPTHAPAEPAVPRRALLVFVQEDSPISTATQPSAVLGEEAGGIALFKKGRVGPRAAIVHPGLSVDGLLSHVYVDAVGAGALEQRREPAFRAAGARVRQRRAPVAVVQGGAARVNDHRVQPELLRREHQLRVAARIAVEGCPVLVAIALREDLEHGGTVRVARRPLAVRVGVLANCYRAALARPSELVPRLRKHGIRAGAVAAHVGYVMMIVELVAGHRGVTAVCGLAHQVDLVSGNCHNFAAIRRHDLGRQLDVRNPRPVDVCVSALLPWRVYVEALA